MKTKLFLPILLLGITVTNIQYATFSININVDKLKQQIGQHLQTASNLLDKVAPIVKLASDHLNQAADKHDAVQATEATPEQKALADAQKALADAPEGTGKKKLKALRKAVADAQAKVDASSQVNKN